MNRLLLLLVVVACGAPDRLDLHVGRTWHEAGSAFNEQQIVGLDSGPSTSAGFSVGWDFGATEVKVTAVAPGVVLDFLRLPAPTPQPIPGPDLDPSAIEPEGPSDVVETLEALDALDWLTRVLLAVLAGGVVWLAWAYRGTVAAWLGRGKAAG